MLAGLKSQHDSVMTIREMKLPNSVAPAFVFNPVPAGMVLDTVKKPMKISAAPKVEVKKPSADAGLAESDTLAFLTLRELAELVKTRKVTSMELTKMYLGRLRKLDPVLHFVINYTEDRALKQAAAADAEIGAGKYRGPLHGIPWGGKDLLAVKGYPTTWGAAGFETQTFDEDAEVVKRLDAAGAVLIAKLAMGALAQNDVWFGERCRNPWNPAQGLEWVVGGQCERDFGRVCRVLDRHGDAGVDLVAFDTVRRDGAAANVWLCAEDGRDGAEAGRWTRSGQSAGAWRTARS